MILFPPPHRDGGRWISSGDPGTQHISDPKSEALHDELNNTRLLKECQ